MKIIKSESESPSNVVWILTGNEIPKELVLTKEWKTRIAAGFKNEEHSFEIQINTQFHFIEKLADNAEKARERGAAICKRVNDLKLNQVVVFGDAKSKLLTLSLVEGMALANYQFLKYFKDAAKRKNRLESISVKNSEITTAEILELSNVVAATFVSRDLVNEPNSFLSATAFSSEMKKAALKSGLMLEVLSKKQIESLGMGGLIAVNKGSVEPPTFNIITWKPQKFKNKKPIVLVGKGIVYDTGGLSLKPTPNSMDEMKCDMAGGAAAFGAILAAAKNKLPLHIVALIPATDNRPGGAAYAPGDVIKMYDATTVEVLNTDAEGRMVLADALSFAKKYKPQEVVDLATLTGAAVRAVGSYGIAGMGNDQRLMDELCRAGESVYERIVPLPLWEEYADEIKSDIADIKNLGGANAGAQTAAIFLRHFTDYPWVHLDIAGPAFLGAASHYRPKGGTGAGVRLLFEFLKNKK
jgi:leucyl aminopeptidase